MEILKKVVSIADLQTMTNHLFGNLVKAVVDIQREVIAIDAELHLYPEFEKNSEDFIEFDSMINLRPSQNNRSRGVNDPQIRQKIKEIVHRWVA